MFTSISIIENLVIEFINGALFQDNDKHFRARGTERAWIGANTVANIWDCKGVNLVIDANLRILHFDTTRVYNNVALVANYIRAYP